MKTTRTIKELLVLMLIYEHKFKRGLCKWACSLYDASIITDSEYQLLVYYINKNRPEFKWYKISMLFNTNSRYYWREGMIEPRIKWIKHHISINK